MLCCGRKKESFEQDFQVTQHRSLLDVTRGSAPRTIVGASGKHQKHLYSRSYPESEAVAFGGRPHLQGRDLDRAGRTANGKRQRQQRDYWVRNKFGGQHQEMLQHQHKIAQKLVSKVSPQIDMGIKSIETFIDYTTVETVEINKRPGQTLGFYIREGNGIDRTDGVFISRIAAGSAVEQNGLLRIGEEILAIDGLSLKGVCLDDVVILMSIPSRLILTVKTRRSCCKNLSCPSLSLTPTSTLWHVDRDHLQQQLQQPQVYIRKKPQQKLADEQPPHQPHISSFSGQYLAQSCQPSQPYYVGQIIPKSHIEELSQGYDYHPFYPRLPYHEYDSRQLLPKSFQKDGSKFPGKVLDTAHDPTFEQFRRSRIKGGHPGKSIMKSWISEGYDKSYRRPQAESLDRHTNGAVLSRKYHSHDYYSDSEAQLTGEYLSPFVGTHSKEWSYKKEQDWKPPRDKAFQKDSDEDDLAGIRELSRSLSRRRKSARLQIEKWKHQREQLDLERRIEEQQKQLYLLQQKLKAELQKQQNVVFARPVLHQKLSYPCHFDLHHDELKLLQPEEKYVSLYPHFPKLAMQQRAEAGDTAVDEFMSKKHSKLKSEKNVEMFDKEEIPTHRRRYSSDSEILQSGNGKNGCMLTSSPSTKLLTSPGLLANGGKCNSLPADIENGSNGDDPTQLKHWLRKLDRLSYDLRDFNHHNNRSKNGNKKDLLDEKQKRKEKKMESDFEKRLAGLQSDKIKWKKTDVFSKTETPEFASYSSDEYKTWLSDRRLQSKLHKEKSEMYASRAGTRPISGRDRAKIALSESRQKLANVHISHIPSKHDRQKKQGPHTSDSLKKIFTTSASQTTPTIDPAKHKGVGQKTFRDARQPAKTKLKTIECAPVTQELDAAERAEVVLLDTQEPESHDYQDQFSQQQHLFTEEYFDDSSKLSKKISSLSTSGDSVRVKAKGGRDQLREEPLKIRVEDFHPHCTSETGIKTEESAVKSSTAKGVDDSLESSQAYTAGVYGLMYVKLYCGHGLKSSRKTMLRDLYCVISFDGVNKARTATKIGALNFDWDEDFEIELDDDHTIGFSIYNWDPVAKQKLCFVSKLAISEFLSVYGNRQQLAMKLYPTGTLYVELHYKDLSERFSRVPVPSEDAIFGVDLDEIISRERSRNAANVTEEVVDSGIISSCSRVPKIVRACIREIELRGLDCVGIYRLCGSYDRLQRLMKELERGDFNEHLLSVNNVPDINVVSNILKTFFQELPEPLLTSDLHQLFVDAINVQIEADPDGNASLMLSILDCLPKNSLAVFSFLMDHLKRIVQHRQFNKMNSLAIGRIFGPLLLCPPISNNRQHTKHSKRYRNSASVDLCKQAQVITYLLDIWPTK